MGHGINLQHGSSRTIVWYSHSFDWAQRAQFNARLVRSGQSKTVSIVNLVADAGLDLLALRALESKEASEKSILEALDIRHHFSKVEEAHAAA
jgi:SNF2 family DNA or RNA helicase